MREAARAPRAPKLSWKEQQELKELPARIEALEREQGELARQLADPAFYSSEPARVRQTNSRHQELEALLLTALERWTELEAKGTDRHPAGARAAGRYANVATAARLGALASSRSGPPEARRSKPHVRNARVSDASSCRWRSRLCLPALARAGQEALNVDPAADATAQEESPLQRSFQPGPLFQGVNAITDLLRGKLKNMPPFFRDTVLTLKPRTYYLNQDRPDGTRSEAWTLGGSLEYISGRFRGPVSDRRRAVHLPASVRARRTPTAPCC